MTETINVDGRSYSREVWEDINFQTFRLAVAQGEFSALPPGTLVAFQKGTLLGWADSLSELLDRLVGIQDPEADLFVEQVNLEEPTVKVRGPRQTR